MGLFDFIGSIFKPATKLSDLVIDEKELDKQIDSGKIKPVHIPQFASFSEIEKFQFCTEIIKYKKANNLKQKDIADVIDVNKSEVSKLFSYNLKEFSQERLLGFIELLIEHGAVIDMEKALRAREAMEKAHKEKKQGKTSKASNFFGRLFED